jgi:hypothetical protein
VGFEKGRIKLTKAQGRFRGSSHSAECPMAATGADPDHSVRENRYITFGFSERGRLLVVAHTEDGDTIRIISARTASKGERDI